MTTEQHSPEREQGVLGPLRMNSADNTNQGKEETKSRESLDAILKEKSLSFQGAVVDEPVKDKGNEILRKSSQEEKEVLPTVLLLESNDVSVPVAVTSLSEVPSEEQRIEEIFEGDHTLDAPSSSTDPNGKDEGPLEGTNLNVDLAIQELLPDGPRWASTIIGTYAIQCSVCLKWRIIPTKEQYEAIGEKILEQPFSCESSQSWRENASCGDPSDLQDDEPTILWAVDKHNIPCPPQGFHRKVVLRGENSSKFADVYYKAPCGKTLRSMVQVQRYLDELPAFRELGVCGSQFCFTSPKPRPGVLRDVVRKRPAKVKEETKKRMKLGHELLRPNSEPLAIMGPDPNTSQHYDLVQYSNSAPQLSAMKGPVNERSELSLLTPTVIAEQRSKVEQYFATSSSTSNQTTIDAQPEVKVDIYRGTKMEIEDPALSIACPTNDSIIDNNSDCDLVLPVVEHSDKSMNPPTGEISGLSEALDCYRACKSIGIV